MKKKAITRGISWPLTLVFIILSMLPYTIPVNADPGVQEELAIAIEYDELTRDYSLSFPAMEQPGRTVVWWHGPTGERGGPESDAEGYYDEVTRRVVFNELRFLPDHIYDIHVEAFADPSDDVAYAAGDMFYLADITFTGESFNVMAKMADIEDDDYRLSPDGVPEGSAVTALSGNNPKIQLRWKIPTINYGQEDESGNMIDEPLNITELSKENFLDMGFCDEQAAIETVGFQINMTKGKGTSNLITFNTDYDEGGNMILEGSDSSITVENGFATLVLDETNGIEPGTEYEHTNIGIIFENESFEQIPVRRTNLRTNSDNHFMVNNIDNAFRDYSINKTSIFTPLQFEITKVDVDKVQVIFKRLTNGIYPELFYQVQYAPRIDDLYTQSEKWVKIPDSALSAGSLYGSEVVEIPISGTQNPEYYFRVVFYDSSSADPISSSLCLDLRLLGLDSGKPPLPKEIHAEPVYSGRKDVTVPPTLIGSDDVRIPMSDLRLSFEKPLNWKLMSQEEWEVFKAEPYNEGDYTFHILLSTYLPDSNPSPETREIGLENTEGIYMPVKQKRVLVIGKKDLAWDPNDPGRLICDMDGLLNDEIKPISGENLFWDYTVNSGNSIDFENNEDPSEDGTKGDYPRFLVPNTTYFMQIFTSRYEDNTAINAYAESLLEGSQGISDKYWGEGLPVDLKNRLSYVSPTISFTTWPLDEMPVPIPDIKLRAEPEERVDPETGDIRLDGIAVGYERVLTEADWQRYVVNQEGRTVRYEFYISQNADDENSFVLIDTDDALYPDASDVINRQVIITEDGKGDPIKPNTVYYIRARATLLLLDENGNTVEILGSSVFTPIKAITTPKIDTGNIDDITRKPRAPSEFNIAVDSNGELRLSDAWVDLSWIHAERDVTYELICTSVSINPEDTQEDFEEDTCNWDFIDAYNEFKFDSADLTITIDPDDPDGSLAEMGFTLDENGRIILPIRRELLRPNTTYFFSLRAVRNQGMTNEDGESIETVSIWVTVPVTTKMVKAPEYLEVVRDLQVGFNVFCAIPRSEADDMEIYMKKATEANSAYVKLLRSQYSVIKDGTTYYFRIYNLEPDLLYHFRLYNKVGDQWYDYDDYSGSWDDDRGDPIPAKTRDTLHEIEVRWAGEEPYEYFLEIRGEHDTDYEALRYRSSGFTDYGYDLPDGSRIMFYREKTKLFVDEGSQHKYIYYALISGKPYRDASGDVTHRALETNLLYYVKLWAYNREESLHIGPVSVRTDFNQDDYDEGKKRDNVEDAYNMEADYLLQKLYWPVDKNHAFTVRVLLKGDMVGGLLQASPGMTVAVDLSGELSDAENYDILVPQKVLEAINGNDSRLNLKMSGTELTLSRNSIDLGELKLQALGNGAKEAMLRVRVERVKKSDKALPKETKLISDIYDLSLSAVGSRYTYGELNTMIYDILMNPDVNGPFKYGIFDRELSRVLQQVDQYSYRSHTELKDMIKTIMTGIEVELSLYLKDILDGGSGLPADIVVNKPILTYPGKVGFRIAYQFDSGLIVPYVNDHSSKGWHEVQGAKGYVMQYVLFRADGPGEYAVATKGSVSVSPGSSYEGVIGVLASKYDLTKVFGNTTIYPGNPVTGQQAILLYAVLSGRENELTGLTPNQKVSALGIGDILGVRELTGYMDNQSSVSLVVRLYCEKSGIPQSMLQPSRTIMITNANQINSRLYRYVVLGIDLGFATTRNNQFDATARSSTGQMLDMVSRALEKLGEI